MTDNADLEARGQRIRELVDDFRRRQRAGEAVSARSLIAAHPELMPELAAAVNAPRLIAEARAHAEAGCADTDDDPVVDTGASAGLQIRCPHCHTSIEIAPDTPFTNITCTVCGSRFSLTADELETRAAGSVTTVGHFELVERLGLGGFGTVWKARDTELDRTVAVKIPRRGELERAEMEQFLREARTVAQLKHPNIVGIHEVGRDGDTVYIVTDLVRGVALSDWLSGRRLTVREAAELCRNVAEALHHAHERGVVHRDVKPQNIMIDAEGRPHLMDFGLARREAGEVTMTMDGQVLGTPAYMSPEQAQGHAHRAGPASDLYSLGVILFELLTGELPFRGNARMLIHQVLHEEAPSPRKLNGNVPPDLETICLKCLEKDPRRRYGSAEELAGELGRFLRAEPIRARPIGAFSRAWRWCKRYPAVSGLAAALLLALVGGLVGVTSQWIRAEKAAERANLKATEGENARRAADKARGKAREEAERNRRLLYISDMNVAQQAWEAANVGRVLDLLDRHRPQPGQEDLRGFEWYYLWRLCQRSLMTPTLQHGSSVSAVAISPSGEMLASGGGDGTVKLWHLATGELQHISTGHTARVECVAFSPNGKTLASGSMQGKVKLWDTATGRELDTFVETSSVKCVMFSSDGGTLASGSWDGKVRLWDVGTGEPRCVLAEHTKGVNSVAYSPDGTSLASGSRDGTVKLWDVATGQQQATFEGHASGVKAVAFSPDGKTLVSGSIDATVKLWDLATGQQLHTLVAHAGTVRSVAFSPDGQTLASSGQDNTVRLWDVTARKLVHTLVGHASPVPSVTFSPDGHVLASGSEDGTVKLWDVASGKEPEILQGHTEAVHSVAFSRVGTVASGSGDGTVKLWDVATGEPRATFEGAHLIAYCPIAFSPIGQTLASSSSGHTLRLWDVASRKELEILEGHTHFVTCVAFSPDGNTLASGSLDCTIKLWEVATGTLRDTLEGHSGGVRAIVFSPNGNTLASGDRDGTVKLWSLPGGEERVTLPGHRGPVYTVAFSPDANTLASGAEGTTVKLWDVATGDLMRTLKGHGGRVLSLAFSPDGKTLASGSGDRTVKLWDVATGEQRATLKGHTDWVSSVAFSPDGKILASAGHDYTIRLWRAATEEEVRQYENTLGGVQPP